MRGKSLLIFAAVALLFVAVMMMGSGSPEVSHTAGMEVEAETVSAKKQLEPDIPQDAPPSPDDAPPLPPTHGEAKHHHHPHEAASAHSERRSRVGARECFLNRVWFQPARCSRAASLLDVVQPTEGEQVVRVVHAGIADAHYRIAEFVDVFEQQGPRGTLLVRDTFNKMHKERLLSSNQSLCGECCECVSAVEKLVRKVPFQATLFYPQLGKSKDVFSKWWSGDVQVVRSAPTASHSRLAGGVDVLSLDLGNDDVGLVKSLVLTKAVPVRSILQFTTINRETNYTDLVHELREVGFVCFIFTAKPVGRSFRGVRLPPYPVAVQMSDCWRPVYNSFTGEPFQFTCVNVDDVNMMNHVRGLAHKTHRGGGAGCLAPHRLGRKKTWEESLQQQQRPLSEKVKPLTEDE